MHIIAVYLMFAAVVLRTVVVMSGHTGFPILLALLSAYGLLLFIRTGLARQSNRRFLPTRISQFVYLFLQASLVILLLIISSYEDFLATLFVPLGLDAVAFFGRRFGYGIILIFSLSIIITFLFSDVGRLFGMVMGILYSGLCFLFGGYADQIQKAKTAHDHNESVFQELQKAHLQLQGFADQRENLAIEHERGQLARELHDSVTQTVFSMNLTAQSAHLIFEKDPSRAAGQLLHLEELAASALREIQSLVAQLKPRPRIEDGLANALRRLTEEQETRNSLRVTFEIHGDSTLSEAVAAGLYSITREALVNVSKHSGVSEATVHLNLVKNCSSLEIVDCGRGFDTTATLDQRGHLGLAGMRERAHEIGWNLSVASQPGAGTRILVTEDTQGGDK
jgi:signal transduction histidine kinase